jgi:hypothetical protein
VLIKRDKQRLLEPSTTIYKRNILLLEIISRKFNSAYDIFLQALRDNDQGQVAEAFEKLELEEAERVSAIVTRDDMSHETAGIVLSPVTQVTGSPAAIENGVMDDNINHELPRTLTGGHRRSLEEASKKLSRDIAFTEALLNKLPLSGQHTEVVLRTQGHIRQMKLLRDAFVGRPGSAFSQLVDSMTQTDQARVSTAIETVCEHVASEAPLSDVCLAFLETQQHELFQNIETTHSWLIDIL